MVHLLQQLQPEVGGAKKIGFEITKAKPSLVSAPAASFWSPAKDWRQHQLLQGALRFLLSHNVS